MALVVELAASGPSSDPADEPLGAHGLSVGGGCCSLLRHSFEAVEAAATARQGRPTVAAGWCRWQPRQRSGRPPSSMGAPVVGLAGPVGGGDAHGGHGAVSTGKPAEVQSTSTAAKGGGLVEIPIAVGYTATGGVGGALLVGHLGLPATCSAVAVSRPTPELARGRADGPVVRLVIAVWLKEATAGTARATASRAAGWGRFTAPNWSVTPCSTRRGPVTATHHGRGGRWALTVWSCASLGHFMEQGGCAGERTVGFTRLLLNRGTAL